MILPALWSRRRLRPLCRLLANGIVQASAAVAKVLLLRHAFDLLVAVAHGEPLARVARVGLALAGLALASGWLRRHERLDAERLGQDYVHAVRLALVDQLHALTPRTINGLSRGGLILRFVGDLSALRQWVSLGVARTFVAGATAAGMICALAVLDPALAGAALAVLVAGTVLLARSAPAYRAAVREARRRRSRLATTVNERIGTLGVALAFGRVREERRRLARLSRRLRDAMIERASRSGALVGLGEGTAALAVAVVLVVGAQRVASGHATPGTIVAGLIVARLLFGPLLRLGRAHQLWQGARVARQKLERFLALPAELVEPLGAPPLVPGPGRLELRSLGAGGVLERLSSIAEPGSIVAIVGPNGAGKSTLLATVAGLLRPTSGHVLLDGQNLAETSARSCRRAIGMVSRDLPLVRGTVVSNIRYRLPEASAEEFDQVVERCGIDEVLALLPDGINSRLAEGAANLSAGHRVRIELARALLGRPVLLLLDEPEANLDAASRARLEEAVAGFAGTVLWATHRPESVLRADQVWRLEAGRLVEVVAGCRRDAGLAPVVSLLARHQRTTEAGG